MNARFSTLLVVALLTGCPGPKPMPDGGSAVTPVISSVSPSSGPVEGGTSVTINGTNFVNGATVTFGGLPAIVTFETDRKLTAIAPAAASTGGVGPVTVAVTNPGGKSSSLTGAFTYEGTSSKTISEAILQNPADTTNTSAAATISVVVSAHVEVPTVTAGTGQGMGVRAQVGFSTTVGATPLSADFTWTDASYVGDVDGAASGDKGRDSYSGTVMLPAPTTGANLVSFVAARFSVDEGVTWTLADRDGAANGVTTTQLSKVTVTRASVEWCKLGGEVVGAPPMVSLRGSAMGPVVYGQVFKSMVTTLVGAGAGIKGALGYGPAGSDPSTWTWVAATFNTDTGGGANDEFKAVLPNPGVGTYKYAFRFNHADGPWSYCDADGLANGGFTEAQAGTLTVQSAGIDSCTLQFPDALTSYEGRASAPVFGRVFVQGLTEAVGAGAGIEGQLGYGAPAVAPTDASWSWTSTSTFNLDDTGGGDEYRATLLGPAPGTYAYAWRFRVSGGPWTYCDKDGSTNGLQQAQLGALNATAFDVTTCQLESANSAQTVLPNSTSQAMSVLVTVPSLTDGVGQGAGLPMEIGYGAVGTLPSTWTNWTAATFANDANLADRYTATITAPATSGAYAVAFRTNVGSRPVVYCDLDGSQNGYQQAQAGRVTVVSALISACKLNTVSAFNLPSGSPLSASATATIPGVSSNAGASPNLQVQIGIGPAGSNGSTSSLWGWQSATYFGENGAADEFRVTTYPAYTGGRAVAARASLDGLSWIYCDLNGSEVGGYEVAQQYGVTVTNHVEFDFCNLQSPSVADGGTVIYGQLYEPGLTPNTTAPITAQLGLGNETEDPGLAWAWSTGTFNGIRQTNNNEYMKALPIDAGVGQRYTFRYTVDGGIWCYGDLDGSPNGFSGGSNVGRVTAP